MKPDQSTFFFNGERKRTRRNRRTAWQIRKSWQSVNSKSFPINNLMQGLEKLVNSKEYFISQRTWFDFMSPRKSSFQFRESSAFLICARVHMVCVHKHWQNTRTHKINIKIIECKGIQLSRSLLHHFNYFFLPSNTTWISLPFVPNC